MTLQTLTGPSIRDALADARRLFGADVVMLQSAPAVGGAPASVTVAFDAPSPAPARPAQPAVTASAAAPSRVYGYGAPRKARPAPTESVAAALLADLGLAGADPDVVGSAPVADARPDARAGLEGTARRFPAGAHLGAPMGPAAGDALPASTSPAATASLSADEGQEGGTPVPGAPLAAGPAPAASAAQLAALQARLADLEAALDAVRPVPAPARPPVVFVGPAGDGKSSLALGLARTPDLAAARCPAAIVVAPDGDAPDAAAQFWAAGIPAAVVRTADEVRDALRTFADADLIVVDTPALSLDAVRAAPVIARLGQLLAPLGAVEVVLAVSAARSRQTLALGTLDALGLRPDALALTRLDEAPDAAAGWTRALALPLRFVSATPGAVEPAPATDAAPPLAEVVLGPLVGPLRAEATAPLPTPAPVAAVAPPVSEAAAPAVEPAPPVVEPVPAMPAPYWRPLAAERTRTLPAPPDSDLWALVAPASTLVA